MDISDDTQKPYHSKSEMRRMEAQKPAAPRVFWVKSHRSGRNISNQLDLFTAVESEPQNPGWIKVIEHSALDKLEQECIRLSTKAGEYSLELEAAQAKYHELLDKYSKEDGNHPPELRKLDCC